MQRFPFEVEYFIGAGSRPQAGPRVQLLLTREPALLLDMVQGVLARPIHDITVLDPGLPGELSTDKHITLDIRASLYDDSRIDLEMQMRSTPDLVPRLVYYAARDYANQLRRGDSYHLPTPTAGIIWLAEPLFPELDRLHSIFELRERYTHTRFSSRGAPQAAPAAFWG